MVQRSKVQGLDNSGHLIAGHLASDFICIATYQFPYFEYRITLKT